MARTHLHVRIQPESYGVVTAYRFVLDGKLGGLVLISDGTPMIEYDMWDARDEYMTSRN